MLKIGAVVNLILAVTEGVLGFRWITQAKEHSWDPKRIFYGAVWFINAFMQTMIACDLWLEGSKKSVEDAPENWDDFDDFED